MNSINLSDLTDEQLRLMYRIVHDCVGHNWIPNAKPQYSLVQFPNEANAVMTAGDVTIRLSYTFIHSLLNVLASGRQRLHEAYPRDLDEFQRALRDLENELATSSVRATAEQEEMLCRRFHERGVGYWSSWMEEPCPWENIENALDTIKNDR